MHRRRPRFSCGVVVALMALVSPSAATTQAPAPSRTDGTSLAVQARGRWTTWWSSSNAPIRWSGSLPIVSDAVSWRSSASGLELGELALAGDGTAWRLRVMLARFDARRFRLALDTLRTDDGNRGAWSVTLARSASIAFNAGQFHDGSPWGWLVLDGAERQPPGVGPLSTAVVVDADGALRLVGYDSIPAMRARVGNGVVRLAFQSYPTLLTDDGVLPPPLRQAGAGVDLEHRDSRLAICALRDGSTLVALTRFGALGDALGVLPFGPTIPELAAIMGALGCRQAVALDGGLSGQLLVRDETGRETAWHGMRGVPLGFVAVVRQ